jgi:peptide/nickel transport system permease protein
MIQFILRRLLLTLPVLVGIVFVVFAIARLLPGDPCFQALGQRATQESCEAFDERYGLNEPIPVQFGIFVGDLLSGDLGTSIAYGRPISDILIERMPVTIELTIFALTIATMLGIGLGVASAARRNSRVDVGTMMFANFGVSIPVFVLGLILIFFFAVVLKDTPFALPPSGRLSAGVLIVPLAEAWGLQDLDGPLRVVIDFLGNMYVISTLITGQWAAFGDAVVHLILPAIALATIPLALIARMTRSSLLEVLGQDYIRTARAKGVIERRVVLRHALRNAILPVVTVIGLTLGALLSGAVLTETIFGLTGIGLTITQSILGRDYPVIQAVTLITAILYVTVNLVVDVSYAFLDPRIRLE